MNAHGTDRNTPSIKQLKDLLGFVVAIVTEIVTEFFFRLSFDEAKALLQSKGSIAKKLKMALSEVFVTDADEYAAQRAYWENFYQTHFGLVADFAEVSIPEKPVDGKWRLIFIPQGLTMNAAFEAYGKILVTHDTSWSMWKYANDLDAAITRNIRTSSVSHAIWVRDEQESDEEFRGRSTEQVDPDQLIGVTVLERLVHGMVHFMETKQHLDFNGITLCSGSRRADGGVPCVRWGPDSRQVKVNWCNRGDALQCGGVRRAVSLPKVA